MCEAIDGFMLCSCLNNDKEIKHNKNSRRYKKKLDINEKNEYVWSLKRFVGETSFHEMGEMGRLILPSSDIGNGLTKEFVLKKLNETNCFDFEYLPKEKDGLSIEVKGNFHLYLAFTFINKKWTLEIVSDPFNEVVENIAKGKLKKI